MSSRIIEALDVVKDISSCFGVGFVAASIDAFSFQNSEEAFGMRNPLIWIGLGLCFGVDVIAKAVDLIDIEESVVFHDELACSMASNSYDSLNAARMVEGLAEFDNSRPPSSGTSTKFGVWCAQEDNNLR